jgi:hypothetical protein
MTKAAKVDNITYRTRQQGYTAPRMITTTSYAPMELGAVEQSDDAADEAAVHYAQLNAVRTHQAQPRKQQFAPSMSREEYERCRRNGLCLKCKQPGHTARFCVDGNNNKRTQSNHNNKSMGKVTARRQ